MQASCNIKVEPLQFDQFENLRQLNMVTDLMVFVPMRLYISVIILEGKGSLAVCRMF